MYEAHILVRCCEASSLLLVLARQLAIKYDSVACNSKAVIAVVPWPFSATAGLALQFIAIMQAAAGHQLTVWPASDSRAPLATMPSNIDIGNRKL